MSVLVECFNVVVKRAEIETCFPGGLEAYAAILPKVFCADEHLTRVGFMASSDLRAFAHHVLSVAGLGDKAEDDAFSLVPSAVAIVEQSKGVWHPERAPWLEYAEGEQAVCWCWLAGTEPGEVATPPGWYPDPSMIQLSDEDVAGQAREGEPTVRLYSSRTFPESEDN